MSLGPAALRRLSALLDEALELPAAEREAWLAALHDEDALLRPILRDLLEKSAARDTRGLVDLRPAFTLPGGGGPLEPAPATPWAPTGSSPSSAAAAWARSGSRSAATAA
mgnify:CR=1 FL=1